MADITINLLTSRNSVPTVNDISLLLNQNQFYIVAGEENATTFQISYPSDFNGYDFYVEMVNAAGAGISRTKLENDSATDWVLSDTEFVLPVGMAVAGYANISITANYEDTKVVFMPVKLKVQNTIPDWRENVSSDSSVYIQDGSLYYEDDNGNVTNLGKVVSETYFGGGVSGNSSSPQIFPYSGIPYASEGDVYINTSDSTSKGNMYKCRVPGNASTAQWAFVGNVSTMESAYDSTTTSISYTLESNTQKTFNASGISSIALTIPSSSYQGFISEVDIFTGSPAPTFSITNNSGKPLKMMKYGLQIESYTPQANKEVNLLFRDNGASIVCAILEI